MNKKISRLLVATIVLAVPFAFAGSVHGQDCSATANCLNCGGAGSCSVQTGTCRDGNCTVCTSCCSPDGSCITIVCDNCARPGAPVGSSALAPDLPRPLVAAPKCAPALPASIKFVAYHGEIPFRAAQGQASPRIEIADASTSLELSNLDWALSQRRLEIAGFSLRNSGAHPLVAYKVRFQVYSTGADEPMEIQQSADLTWTGPNAFIKPGGQSDVKMKGWVAPKEPASRIVAVVSYAEFDDGTRSGPEAKTFFDELSTIRSERQAIYRKALAAYRESGPQAALTMAVSGAGSKGVAADMAGEHLAEVYSSNGGTGLLEELRRVAEPAEHR